MLLLKKSKTPEIQISGNAPIERLSVISTESNLDFDKMLRSSFYYEVSNFNGFLELLQQLASFSFWLQLTKGDSCLVIDSQNPNRIDLHLSEHDLTLNNYITRYLKFTKQSPMKAMGDTKSYYRTSMTYDDSKTTKDHRDFRFLLDRVFSDALLRLSLKSAVTLLENHRQTPNVMSLQINERADLSPLKADHIDESHDFYEYLSLLHLNKVPEISRSEYEKVTSMYEVPAIGPSGNSPKHLFLFAFKFVHPAVLQEVVIKDSVISTLSNTKLKHRLSYRSASGLYTWMLA